jgi:hypothetical protein
VEKNTRVDKKTRWLRVADVGATLSLKAVKGAQTVPSEASLANLKPFKPGQSGNPGGRRARPLSDRYQKLMETALPREIAIAMKLPAGTLWADAIAHVSARTALKANETGILQRKEIREAIEGKAVARVEVFSDEQIDIHVSFEDTSKLLNAHTPVLDVEPVDVAEELPADTDADGGSSEE